MIPLLAAGDLQSAALGLLTAVATLAIIAALKWASGKLQKMYEKSHAEDERLATERHKETMDGQALLHASDDRIEAHVKETNGRVTKLEDKERIESERRARWEGVMEGQVGLLLKEKGLAP